MRNLLKYIILLSALSFVSPVLAQDIGLPKGVPEKFENYRKFPFDQVNKNFSNYNTITIFYDVDGDSKPDAFDVYWSKEMNKPVEISKENLLYRGFDINGDGEFSKEESYDAKNRKIFPERYFPQISENNCA